MENRFIRRFPRFFPSSLFNICHFRNIEDAVESSILRTKITQNNLQRNQDDYLYFPRTQTNCSLNKPQKPKNPRNDRKERTEVLKVKNSASSSSSGWFSSEEHELDRETDAFFSLSSVSSASIRLKSSGDAFQKKQSPGRKPLTASIPSKLTQTTSKRYAGNTDPRQKTPKTCRNNQKFHGQLVEDYYEGCRKTSKTSQRPCRSNQRRSTRGRPKSEVGWCSSIVVDSKVEASYAVEMSSSDPYGDFGLSMVEMIVEKQIFGGEDLEGLLHRFLSLNSPAHHKVIVQVFSEICDTLFSN